MTEHPLIPFLSEFFEPRSTAVPSALGTETFTKANESGGDTDAAPEGSARRSSVAHAPLGTETATNVRREDADPDEPRRGAAAILGTETATRAREDADVDASHAPETGSLWAARVL